MKHPIMLAKGLLLILSLSLYALKELVWLLAAWIADGMTVSVLDKQTSFKASLGKYKTNKNERRISKECIVSNG